MVDERYTDLKEDFKETKKDVKELSKSITTIEKSMITSEATQKAILVILTTNKENLIILTKDIETKDIKYTERMDAITEEINTIKELPYKNYVRMKWIFYTTMAGSAWAIYEKVLKGFIENLFK